MTPPSWAWATLMSWDLPFNDWCQVNSGQTSLCHFVDCYLCIRILAMRSLRELSLWNLTCYVHIRVSGVILQFVGDCSSQKSTRNRQKHALLPIAVLGRITIHGRFTPKGAIFPIWKDSLHNPYFVLNECRRFSAKPGKFWRLLERQTLGQQICHSFMASWH